MQIARVVGTVVSTQKHRKFEGAKLLLVQPLDVDDSPRGGALLAVDGVGAGVHEKVLIVLEGRAAGEAAAGASHVAAAPTAHPSHVLLPLARGGDAGEGACLIEPAVRCNHC